MPNLETQYDYKTLEKKLHLKCAGCGTDIAAKDINITKSIAKCDDCDNIFQVDNDIFENWDRRKPEMFIPEGLEVLKLPSELDIQIDWFKSQSKSGTGFQTLFTFMWNILLLPFVLTAISSGQYEILLFAGIHILVGLGFILNMVSSFVNKTYISITKRYIEIKQKPIPSFLKKNVQIPTSDVSQLYVSRYVKSTNNGVANHAYGLYLIKKNGQKIPLIKDMNKETQLYLEQEIELFLDIEDKPVRGEVTVA